MISFVEEIGRPFFVPRDGREWFSPLFMLVGQQLVEVVVCLAGVATDERLVEQLEEAAHEEAVLSGDGLGYAVLYGRVPHGAPLQRVGKELQRAAMLQFHDEHQSLVHLGGFLIELVLLVAVIIVVDQRSQDVVVGKKTVDGGTVGQLQA